MPESFFCEEREKRGLGKSESVFSSSSQTFTCFPSFPLSPSLLPLSFSLTSLLSHLVRLQEVDHVLVRLGLRVDPRFRADDGQREGVEDHEGVAGGAAGEHAHDLEVASRLGVHRHLQQSQGRDVDAVGVVVVVVGGVAVSMRAFLKIY